jgi:DHA2 family multidrug resistance protein
MNLSTKVSLLNAPTQSAYYQSSGGMAKKMSDEVGMATGSEAALKGLYYRVQNQVFMLSFNQLIWTIMAIFAISFIPLYRLKLRFKPTGPIDSH